MTEVLGDKFKRAHQRLDVDLPVGIFNQDGYRVERAVQIGGGGLLFESSRNFYVGQKITVSLDVADYLLQVDGEVAYIFAPGVESTFVGVKFAELTELQRTAFCRFFMQLER